ncbi:hypothetical protein ABE61_24235 [Lysinibacillus sphaericus]|uniref:hypothetical protein n=1 Tax=Lysinibacillus sphaericus TaxID=1421 RepID=UPI0018CC9601|nr:hypothetical protein [Lysinibacillus sphaericus]MBG9456996.1 hypothetical protein [Lysinibacillus sphaericus]MBG9480512.1 hypothetical protein [Lysinibacillus sphaericus]MBG9593008.1 hypothetical protein [Lysinibacillus sphaericus]
MEKGKNKLMYLLGAIAGVTFISVIILTIIAYQIGVEKLEQTNRSTIIGGLLSMAGGIAGAFGAYFIARMQMTKQLELQYKKEREKMILEIRINKVQDVIQIINQIKKEFELMTGEYAGFKVNVNSYLGEENLIFVNMEYLNLRSSEEEWGGECLNSLKKTRNDYQSVFSYKAFLNDDILKIIEIFNEDSLRPLVMELFNFMYFMDYEESIYNINEFRQMWWEEREKMDLKLLSIQGEMNIQLEYLESELSSLLQVE